MRAVVSTDDGYTETIEATFGNILDKFMREDDPMSYAPKHDLYWKHILQRL